MLLRAGHYTFEFPRPALVMGIVNVTPDSFSDGGQFLDPGQAIDRSLRLVEEGAEIIDIGGESTRPDATPVSAEEELRRILPVIRELAQQARVTVPISIDTMKPAVARAAVEAGATIINDVAANRRDAAMWQVARDTGAAYVVMHMLGTPQTMQCAPHYEDVVEEVGGFFRDRLSRLAACGVQAERTILDPGLGFGKKLEHNLELLARLDHFKTYGRPLLVGASRKAFVGQVTGAKETVERLPGSLACACAAVAAGAQIVRSHDVAATRRALRMTEAIRAKNE